MTDPEFYPLDPLSAAEFSATVEILAAAHGVVAPAWRYANIEMAEPDKAALAGFDSAGVVPPRQAIVTCFERATNSTYKALVSLTDAAVVEWTHIPGVQANFTVDEWTEADEDRRLLAAEHAAEAVEAAEADRKHDAAVGGYAAEVLGQSAKAVEELVREAKEPAWLEQLLEAEQAGKARKGLLQTIRLRLAVLEGVTG